MGQTVRVEPEPVLTALYRIASLAGSETEPRAALGAILDTAIELFSAVSGSISLVNPDTGKLEIEIQRGLDPEEDIPLRMGQGVTGWVAFHGRPLLIPDVISDSRYVRIRFDVRSEMAVPMLDDATAQVIGVINLDSNQVSGFGEDDLAQLVRIAAEATAVMKRLWRFAQLQVKAQQLEAIIGIGQSLVTKLEPQELLNAITRDTRRITRSRACALYLHDADAAGIRLAAYDGSTPPASVPGELMPLNSCLVASALHTRKQVEFPNVQAPEFIDVVDLPPDTGLRSLLASPMSDEHEVIGVLAVFTDHIHRFNNDEKRLLAVLASLGAVALQNSRLYARVFQSEASLRKNEQLTTLGLLAAEIAHEIRNPLTVLKLLFGSLNLEFPDGDPRRTDVRVIGEKLDQLEAIVSRVLNFAKAPSSLHSRWDVAGIIEDTLVLIRLKLAQSKIHLTYQPPTSPLMVDVQKGHLQQVLLNLLINSTQAMPDGGRITLAVSTEVRPEGMEVVCIDITDTGPGIPPALRDQVFDSFLSGRADGTGLGLAIAKRILASHHGDLLLSATGPEGTTMRIVLPLARS